MIGDNIDVQNEIFTGTLDKFKDQDKRYKVNP